MVHLSSCDMDRRKQAGNITSSTLADISKARLSFVESSSDSTGSRGLGTTEGGGLRDTKIE